MLNNSCRKQHHKNHLLTCFLEKLVIASYMEPRGIIGLDDFWREDKVSICAKLLSHNRPCRMTLWKLKCFPNLSDGVFDLAEGVMRFVLFGYLLLVSGQEAQFMILNFVHLKICKTRGAAWLTSWVCCATSGRVMTKQCVRSRGEDIVAGENRIGYAEWIYHLLIEKMWEFILLDHA